MARFIRNFVVVNVFMLFPLLWALMGWMPAQMLVRVRGREVAPAAVMANGTVLNGRLLGGWEGGRVFRYFLRPGMEWKDFEFSFPGVSGAEVVESVELQKWKLVSLRKAGRGLVESGEGTGVFAFADPRFDSVGLAKGKIPLALAALELMLAALSLLAVRWCREESWKGLLPAAIAAGVALALLAQVALPVQSYLANRASFAFSPGELLGAVWWRFAVMAAWCALSAAVLAKCFGRWVFGMFLAVAVCVYLESGILSNGLGSLNGDLTMLLDRTRKIWDAGIWAGVFAVALALHPLLKKHYGIAFLCLMAMVAASMFDTRREAVANKSRMIVGDFSPLGTVIRNATYSGNRNVMVFILDSLEREQAHAAVEDPEAGAKLREQFRGFTEYTNNVGALPQTLYAVPHLLTGRYPDGTETIADYSWSCYGQDSALGDYLDAGWDVCLTTAGVGCGYSTRTNEAVVQKVAEGSVLDRPANGGEGWSIRDVSRWRWMPYAAKAPVMTRTGQAGNAAIREWGVFPELAKAEVVPDARGSFLLIHTEGVHIPVWWNRHGEMLSAPDDSDRGCTELGIYILEKLGDLLDELRKKGVYDNSLILVLGDHGAHGLDKFLQEQQDGVLPSNARASLWVKPAGASEDFRTSGLPTGHGQIADLLKAAAQRELSREDVEGILRSDRRVFRRMSVVGTEWTDWVVDADGSFKIEKHEASLAARGGGHPLKPGRRYSLRVDRIMDFDADLVFQDLGDGNYAYMRPEIREGGIQFLVPEAGKRYALRVEFRADSASGPLRFRSGAPGAEWTECGSFPQGEITVGGIVADETKTAGVRFERGEGPSAFINFTGLTLLEE